MRTAKLFIAGALTLAATATAWAQTAPTGPDGFDGVKSVQDSIASPKTMDITRIITAQPTAANTAAQTSATINDLANDPRLANRDLSQFRILGTTTPIRTSSGKIVRFDWTTIRRLDIQENKVLKDPLTTQMNVDGAEDVIPKELELKAKGDVDQLVNSVLELLDTKPATQETAKVEQQPQQQQNDQNSSGSPAPQASGAQQSDQSLGYKTPSAIEQAADPVIGTTTEGCKPVFRDAEGVVVIQEQTVQDGVPQGNCGDTLTRLEVKRAYMGCPDITSYDATSQEFPYGYAVPSYRRYYLSGSETKHLDPECLPDNEIKLAVQENPDSCGWSVDQAALTATKQVKTFYTNRQGVNVPVSDTCLDTTSQQPVTIAQDVVNCQDEPDTAAGVARQRGRYVWTVGGKEESTTCQYTGVEWPIFPDFTVCAWGNTDTQAYPQFRDAYDTGTDTKYIDPVCRPDMTQAVDLVPTEDGCTSEFVDEIPYRSFGTQRFYYMKGGNREYVTGCQKNDVAVFNMQSRVASWICDDAIMECTPKTELYITTPFGEFVRSPAQVRSGAVAQPYEFTATNEVLLPATFETATSCDKWQPSVMMDIYRRADGTNYESEAGPGPTYGPTYSCSGRGGDKATDWTISTTIGHQGVWTTACSRDKLTDKLGHNALYKATRELVRDDGVVVASQTNVSSLAIDCGIISWGGWATGCPGGPGYVAPRHVGINAFSVYQYHTGAMVGVSGSCPANPAASSVGSLLSGANFIY